ncbi:hypothetical protein KBA73_03970 [Patescibacteria group bacterium]|nr:hypothetical protein [Patescibacteria group bacterium]
MTNATVPMVKKSFTISQALRRLKVVKGDLAKHGSRASQGVSYRKEDRKPTYEFQAERAARAAAQEEMILLETGIARANALTLVSFEGRELPIAEAIRRLQEFKANIAWYGGLSTREGEEKESYHEYDASLARHVTKERPCTYVCELPERGRDAVVEALQVQFQTLNDVVETANHVTRFEVELPAPSLPAG